MSMFFLGKILDATNEVTCIKFYLKTVLIGVNYIMFIFKMY